MPERNCRSRTKQEIIVKDKAGNELSWTTGESAEDQNEDGSAKPHKVKLVAGTYILKEVSAPFGYLMADPITFTVGLDGKLSSKAEGAVSNDENKAVVINERCSKGKISSFIYFCNKEIKNSCRRRYSCGRSDFLCCALCRRRNVHREYPM